MIEVYYAEDDETIGKSVKEYLEQQNCKVAVFDRIADVKKALIGHLPTIVLLDWNMPDGQGSENSAYCLFNDSGRFPRHCYWFPKWGG